MTKAALLKSSRTRGRSSSPATLDGRVALRLERDAAQIVRERTERRPALVLSLENGIVEIELGGKMHRLDRASFAVIPASRAYRLTSRSPAARFLTLLLGPESVRRVVDEYHPHVDERTFDQILSSPHVLPRTRWFDELAHRYVFERAMCKRHDSEAARFLETEMVKEVYFLGKEQLSSQSRESVLHEEDVISRRARQWIEDHLFESFPIATLARECRTSESTLLRTFRREFGVAPTEYLRYRRLDESVILLRSGRYAVREVAMRVGYANVPAFTVAFGKRFGVAPSTLLRANPEHESLSEAELELPVAREVRQPHRGTVKLARKR